MTDARGAAASCGRTFDESLLTGYLDRVLTQEDEQRVRIHLEDCASCRGLVDELETMRSATMTTQFHLPSDDQWNETPRGSGSGLAFGIGWLLLVIWLVGVAGFALGEAWQGTGTLLEKLLAFGGVSAVALLLLSVVLDRLKTSKTDRYRRVKR